MTTFFPTPNPHNPNPQKRILIIEDDRLVRDGLLDLLEAADFEVSQADDGLVGLEMARNDRPNLIISDVMMPNLNGYGVLEVIRRTPELAAIPFIFLTAKSHPEDRELAMRLGTTAYLTKPYSLKELLELIETLLESSNIYKKAELKATLTTRT